MPYRRSGAADPTLGALLRGYRQRALLTQDELADRTGLSTRTIRRLESNRLLRPRMATVRLLASHLELSPAEQSGLVEAVEAAPAGDGAARPPAATDVLPPDIVDFTGRSAIVEGLAAVLSAGAASAITGPAYRATRVVGVSGPPGVGKTTLAIHVAHLLRRRFPDGRLYVDLRGTTGRPLSPDDALHRLLRWSVGQDGAIPDDLDERVALLRSTLAPRSTLLVLDNAASETQVRPLLPGGPGCAVLFTSRRPLAALDGAIRFDLGLFDRDESLDLLASILGADRIAAEPDAATRIVELCANLPLAVRLAGASLSARPHWTLRRMAEQLSDEHQRLDALSVGDRAVRSNIALSYDALDPPERRLFRLLGALTGTDVPSWVAAAVLELSVARAEELLESLVEARLLTAHGSGPMAGRFGMHNLVRLYARERCAAEEPTGELTHAAERLTGGWLYLAEQAQAALPGGLAPIGAGTGPRWRVPEPVRGAVLERPLDWFDAERLALASAVDTACDLGLDELAWDLTGSLGRFLELRGDYVLWRAVLERSLTAVRAAGNRRGEAHLLRALAEVWLDLDEYTRALDCLERALRSLTELGEARAEAHVQRAIGVLLRMRGDKAGAAERLRRAMSVFSHSDDPVGLADTLFSLGALHADEGEHAEALATYERALGLEYQLGNRLNQALLLCSISSELIALGLGEQARSRLAGDLAVAVGVDPAEAFMLAFLGEAETVTGHSVAAAEHLASALEIFRRIGERYGEAVTLRNLGDLHRRLRAYDAAREAVDRALAIWDELDMPRWRGRTLVTLGRVQLDAGDRAGARAAWLAADEAFARLEAGEREQVRTLLCGVQTDEMSDERDGG